MHGSLIAVALAFGSMSATTDLAADDDPFCGPRAVRATLEWFKMPADLVGLIESLQWPDIESGTSFASIDKLLKARGLYTYALQIDVPATISWDYPAIVYTHSPGKALGHFKAILPSTTERPRLFVDPFAEQTPADFLQLSNKNEAVVVLIAPHPISQPVGALKAQSFSREQVAIMVALCLSAVFIVTAMPLIRLPRRSTSHRN